MSNTSQASSKPSGHVPVALVTGGSSGIGLAAAIRLAERGFRVCIVGRQQPKLDDAIARLHQTAGVQGHAPGGERFASFQCDLAESDAPQQLVREAVQKLGRLDAIVLNAGDASLLPVAETTDRALQDMFALNTFAPAQMIRAAWPTFAEQGGGCIVAVSSIAAIDPFEGFFAYGATKAALNSFVRSAAKEGAPLGIRAFAVAPGAVETPLLRSLIGEESLPTSACLVPDDVGQLITDCVAGARPDDNGRAIYITRTEAGVQIKVGD
ncbi:MAG: SDR family oxidoreductase [Phycisphaerales bacterium]|nr:SDR family oxidoreductase [Phycisphaerales bacterium]